MSALARSLAALTLATAVAAGCGSAGDDATADSVLTIYVSAPLTGEGAEAGQDLADGATLALADAGGESAGVEVRAEVLDVAGEGGAAYGAAEAGANARSATEDSTAIGYLGELASGATLASLPITNEAGILQVAPGSGADELVREQPFNDEIPLDVQTTGERTFGRVAPADEDARAQPAPLDATARRFANAFQAEYGRKPTLDAAYGYEAMAVLMDSIERASDATDRAAVVDAFFETADRESILGTYSVTDEGETTLERPPAFD